VSRPKQKRGASPVLTVDEVCEWLQIHPGTLYRLVKFHDFPGFRVGSDWRFNIEQVLGWAHYQEQHLVKK
jgi:excisionase family DNA binding protein